MNLKSSGLSTSFASLLALTLGIGLSQEAWSGPARAPDILDQDLPGEFLGAYDCSEPLKSCNIPSLEVVRAEKKKFEDAAPARVAKILGEIDRWKSVETRLKKIAEAVPAPSRFRDLYLHMADRVSQAAQSIKNIHRVQEDADLFSLTGAAHRALVDLETLRSQWTSTLDQIRAYNLLYRTMAGEAATGYTIRGNYRGDMSNEVRSGDYFWDLGEGGGVIYNPVRKMRVDLSNAKLIKNSCYFPNIFLPDFYIVGLETHQDLLAEDVSGLTLLADAEVIRKMVDGNGDGKPLEYRCPENNRMSGKNKGALWYDSKQNLLVDDVRKRENHSLFYSNTTYTPVAGDAEVVALLRYHLGAH